MSVMAFNLKEVSEGLFNSALCYCLPLFGGCDISEVKSLQVLQNKAAQMVTNLPPRSVRNLMFDQLDWLSLNQLIMYHTLLAVFRVRSTGEPEYLAATLCNDSRLGRITVPNVHLSLAQKSFKIRGAVHWNALPPYIRSVQKVGIFKKEVKKWIKDCVPRFLD